MILLENNRSNIKLQDTHTIGTCSWRSSLTWTSLLFWISWKRSQERHLGMYYTLSTFTRGSKVIGRTKYFIHSSNQAFSTKIKTEKKNLLKSRHQWQSYLISWLKEKNTLKLYFSVFWEYDNVFYYSFIFNVACGRKKRSWI